MILTLLHDCATVLISISSKPEHNLILGLFSVSPLLLIGLIGGV